MDRRLPMRVAAGCAFNQAVLLCAVKPALTHVVGPRLADGLWVAGLGADGFAVERYDHVRGWAPQFLFVVVSAVLTYTVLRTAPHPAPYHGSVRSSP